MVHTAPAQAPVRRTRSTVLAALAVVSAVLVGLVGWQSWAASTSARAPISREPLAHRPHDGPHRDGSAAFGKADGVVPDGVTVFDDAYPAVANLDPDLLDALRRAAMDAAGSGIEFFVNSGWRTPAYQKQLLDEAVSKYGSVEEAARWVATPTTSAHVSGDAVDIGHSEATAWLAEHGAAYGLCRIYDNEVWHYELRPEATDHGCPPRYADPTQDPRVQQ